MKVDIRKANINKNLSQENIDKLKKDNEELRKLVKEIEENYLELQNLFFINGSFVFSLGFRVYILLHNISEVIDFAFILI